MDRLTKELPALNSIVVPRCVLTGVVKEPNDLWLLQLNLQTALSIASNKIQWLGTGTYPSPSSLCLGVLWSFPVNLLKSFLTRWQIRSHHSARTMRVHREHRMGYTTRRYTTWIVFPGPTTHLCRIDCWSLERLKISINRGTAWLCPDKTSTVLLQTTVHQVYPLDPQSHYALAANYSLPRIESHWKRASSIQRQ